MQNGHSMEKMSCHMSKLAHKKTRVRGPVYRWHKVDVLAWFDQQFDWATQYKDALRKKLAEFSGESLLTFNITDTITCNVKFCV